MAGYHCRTTTSLGAILSHITIPTRVATVQRMQAGACSYLRKYGYLKCHHQLDGYTVHYPPLSDCRNLSVLLCWNSAVHTNLWGIPGLLAPELSPSVWHTDCTSLSKEWKKRIRNSTFTCKKVCYCGSCWPVSSPDSLTGVVKGVGRGGKEAGHRRVWWIEWPPQASSSVSTLVYKWFRYWLHYS